MVLTPPPWESPSAPALYTVASVRRSLVFQEEEEPIKKRLPKRKRKETFLDYSDDGDDFDDSVCDKHYTPETIEQDHEEFEDEPVEKEAIEIIENYEAAKEEENIEDPHPSIKMLSPGCYELEGKNLPFLVKPHENICTGCGVKSKSRWCSHLVAAGLREGIKYKGKVHVVPLQKLVHKQRETQQPSGRKAPRRFDYRPNPRSIEVHDVDIELDNEEDVDVEVPTKTVKKRKENPTQSTKPAKKAKSQQITAPCDICGLVINTKSMARHKRNKHGGD